jgi:DNA polymerase III delta prime subunit
MIKKLSYTKLRKDYDISKFKFKDTSEVEPLYDVIGQDRAVEALEYGLQVKIRGYNIYLSGSTGTGKTSYAVNYIQRIAESQEVPNDWCYVYNFENPNQPIAINLVAGEGKVFQEDINDFVKVIEQEIPKAFDSEDYEREKSKIASEFQRKRNDLLEELNRYAKKHDFKVKTTSTGIYFIPVLEGKIITEEEYEVLEEKQKHVIDERSSKVQFETLEIIRKLKNIEKEVDEKVAKWEKKVALFAIGMQIDDLRIKYKKHPKIIAYLDNMQKDILKNIDQFKEEDVFEEQQQLILPFMKKSERITCTEIRGQSCCG